MKERFEIEKELESVEMALRTAYKDDQRRQKWEGYRDALLWVLGMLKDEEKKKLRTDILTEVAQYAVYLAMAELRKQKLQRCDLCEGQPPDGELCDDDTDCLKYGFKELESIDSATKKITTILAGRT